MRVSEAVVTQLVEVGVDTVFGIPGTQTLPLNEDMDGRDEVQYVVPRHETAVTHEAWGYAQATGDPAATMVIPGPGELNGTNGLKNAKNDCAPMVHLSIETEPEVRGHGGIHETPPDTYDNLVKENVTVNTPESTAVEVARAVAIATTPPKGPVRVGIPKNFLKMDCPIATTADYDTTYIDGVSEEQLANVVDVLDAAERPFILAGNGVRAADAEVELREVVEALDVPVAVTYKGKGIFPEDHNLFLGVMCAGSSTEFADYIADADAAVVVGSDLDAVTTQRWSFEMPESLVHATLQPKDIGSGYDPSVGVVADAADFLGVLADCLETDAGAETDSAAQVRAVREAADERCAPFYEETQGPFASPTVLKTLREVLPRKTIITSDSGGFRLWAAVRYPAYEARNYIHNGSWASMGVGLPAAIGAQAGRPDEPVVALTGDGGLMMCVHELHTAVNEELSITVIVANNNDYGVISDEAANEYGLAAEQYAWADRAIDFCAMAESMGMDSALATTTDEIREAAERAVESDDPWLIEMPIVANEPQAYDVMQD